MSISLTEYRAIQKIQRFFIYSQ